MSSEGDYCKQFCVLHTSCLYKQPYYNYMFKKGATKNKWHFYLHQLSIFAIHGRYMQEHSDTRKIYQSLF